jgi:hypothetical protein
MTPRQLPKVAPLPPAADDERDSAPTGLHRVGDPAATAITTAATAVEHPTADDHHGADHYGADDHGADHHLANDSTDHHSAEDVEQLSADAAVPAHHDRSCTAIGAGYAPLLPVAREVTHNANPSPGVTKLGQPLSR